MVTIWSPTGAKRVALCGEFTCRNGTKRDTRYRRVLFHLWVTEEIAVIRRTPRHARSCRDAPQKKPRRGEAHARALHQVRAHAVARRAPSRDGYRPHALRPVPVRAPGGRPPRRALRAGARERSAARRRPPRGLTPA